MLTTTRENKKATFSRSKRQLSISITNGIDNALLLTNPFKLNLSHDVKTLNVLHLFFKLKLCSEVQDLTFFFIFFAGGTVSEEKQKDAGHFDPLCHSPRSYYYSFWNKVLILHSSSFCFLSGCLLCICVDLDSCLGSTPNKDDCLSYSPGNKEKEESQVLFTGALWVVRVYFNERNNQSD